MNRKKLDVSKGSPPSKKPDSKQEAGDLELDPESLFERGSPKPPAPKPSASSASKPGKGGDITLAGAEEAEQGFEIETNQLKTNAYIQKPATSGTPSGSGGKGPVKLAPKGATPDRRASRPQLSIWTPETLKQGKETYEKALMQLLPKGLSSALFLQGDQRAPYNKKLPPIFLARTAFGSRQQLAVWNGLRWDPESQGKLWAELFQAAYLELGPPSAGLPSPAPSPKTFLRSAFGVDPLDTLTLVRIGTADSTTGLLALLSRSSLAQAIETLLPSLVAGAKLKKSA